MSARPTNAPIHSTWLVDPEVTQKIEQTLRRHGLKGPDLEDHRQEVLRMALAYEPPPPTRAECIALVRTIASARAVDHIRRLRRRARYNVGLFENPDERPAPGVAGRHSMDVRRQLDVVARDIESGRVTARQAEI